MDDRTALVSLIVLGALMVLPWGRRVVKLVFTLAIGLFLLLLWSEPNLD